MPKLSKHRRHPGRYDLAIERPGQPDREFTWPPDPPEGMARGDYEKMMQREAVLLAEAEAQQAAERALPGTKVAGTKVAGEGVDVSTKAL